MNQQRSRRFRTAKDADDAKRKAIAKGEELPEEEQFDRNCITPGNLDVINSCKSELIPLLRKCP